MKILQLLEHLVFHDDHAYSDPLFVDVNGRVLRFALKPGQTISEHQVPTSPFYAIVLQGHGLFSGNDGVQQRIGPNTLLVFDVAEKHAIRALDEDLVFIGFLQGVSTTRLDHVGGEIGRTE